MQRSLTDPELAGAVDRAANFRILRDATVIKIGGQSVVDRGRAAVYPLVDGSFLPAISTNSSSELAQAPAPGKSLLDCGRTSPAGRRALAARRFVADQNAAMLGQLLAKHGISAVAPGSRPCRSSLPR